MQHSTIANVTISEQYEALVLKDIVQVEHVLRQYINGTVNPATQHHQNTLNTSNPQDQVSTALVTALGIQKLHDDRVEQRLQQLLETLKTTKQAEMKGDHDVSGTAFFKVGAFAVQYESAIALKFSCAGGYDLNAYLANALQLPQNLSAIQINAQLSTNDQHEFTYDLPTLLNALTPYSLQGNLTNLLTPNEEFTGLNLIATQINQAYYLLSLNFPSTPLCGYVKSQFQGTIKKTQDQQIIPPQLTITLRPAQIVTEKNALGDTYRRMVGKQGVTYTKQDIEAVQSAAHTIKSAML
ncbi:MAG: hypothetical protein A2912_05815 [Candidatus Buchananbacteria bacterium RIFCSPLOWO2_01_FULL_40_23b]|uniref:Uncharacterized protein n=1 Tax=Candidatus Buchananbacteria bacterium RIFCSPLOWO2_01_FULL_40_23b TaxID=1797544 RepID=A0A1G1YT16_9BACT|nr:MAG: hypothetical protein A2912_05815 [Candidatus Buchananbacteria bacterium RIFCSPLOWO2_01_FULL_40_23b]